MASHRGHSGVLKVFRVSHFEELPKESAIAQGNPSSPIYTDKILVILASLNDCSFSVPLIWLAVGRILVLDENSVPLVEWG